MCVVYEETSSPESRVHKKNFGIDAAFCIFENSNQAQEEQGQIPPHNNNDYKEIFIGYMKSPLIQEIDKKRQKCYPTVWFDRQLVFKFNYGDFEPGDSGTSVVGKNGKALGILHVA
ncbi:uncharacterized protein OCT59_003841 [Rhizophagus irregularis]|uniref:uncharacterized protein n=1 Tax=Rhizophagus irregularis TaxID=588596 RepID=UPI00333350CB|nr:hypothetical protein OCT59_003841 [Rhizophagus irregularis]